MTSFGKFIKRLLLALMVLVVAFHVLVAGLLLIWKTQPINNSMFMLTHRIMGGDVSQTWVEYDAIAKSAKQAAIVSEDSTFSQHNGFDMKGIKAAQKKNEATGKMSAGGSTITQQLAKNLFLTSHRSYTRKAEEAVLTIMIETLWDKQRILTAYLNVAEFGNGIYGVEAAAQYYFDKSAANLNRDQSALLIAMLTNPKYYESHQSDKRLRNKQRIIKKRMKNAVLPQSA
ncbi:MULTISPECIES: monofunctional biosynthetic peptidoglycan transglycosylase [Psychrobacter]|uniref:Biosynthetic peptidoglycan transglycosylase n=1 Tax=Psychrobacter cryohalolentis (strain ATCC BAA-1226 / DSM 17306 / VKM B-2378 / K5) TaxID=335284 RepID=Q1Q9J3_PSYCK|nr:MULTISPECIES: monofunctional biosynthetic peptidoglycan transglycosylase [Psychrobacter]ABE75660.1 Monofunctional biosynthetic peptidoglycan transglycosylase [Psychrobacter cryohalolentis K5]AGP49535.1 peptidoglycan transglycosylase [Psychrobacter sp. G]ASE25851.1 monofunctional biosynthetic peptidoglycan transglycosylase [Psychrobacter cryohalolentis]KAA0928898.1 monofunctional biosynthetic peptidoglycan transglycosylase [Psychrobacter sp. ANT_H56B]KAA0938395.1 monofunctional biosynthetic |tara:strand:- start:7788 stop:8474 length:687 start_codon:yes stop_codon:yes gene_type:complete